MAGNRRHGQATGTTTPWQNPDPYCDAADGRLPVPHGRVQTGPHIGGAHPGHSPDPSASPLNVPGQRTRKGRAVPAPPSPSPTDGLVRPAAPLKAWPELRVLLPGAVEQPSPRAGPQPCPVWPHSLRSRSSSFWRCSFAFWWASYIWAMNDLRLGISYSQQTNALRRRPFA